MKFAPRLHKLSNGLVVILDPMDLETANMQVQFGVGARDEAPNEYGITHFAEHMLCKGTKRFPTDQAIKNHIEAHGGTRNAGTSNGGMGIYGRILAENLPVLADLLADMLNNSLFDEKTLENERGVILDEYRRDLDSNNSAMYSFTVYKIFAGSGMAHNTLGAEETIAAFTRGQMIDYLKRHISAKNTIMGISGKIEDQAKLLDRLENLFGGLPSFDVAENSDAAVHPTIAHNPRPEQKQTMLSIGFEDIWPQTFENRPKQYSVSIFQGTLARRLMEEVRNKAGLVYGIHIGGYGNEKIWVNAVKTSASPENIGKVVAITARTCKDIIRKNPITLEELDLRKTMDKLNEADFLESAGHRCDRLVSFYMDFGRLYDFYEASERRRKLTLDEVIENSRAYFDRPISIITQGAVEPRGLEKIWRDNFN